VKGVKKNPQKRSVGATRITLALKIMIQI
jgi:hypothetical protein